MKNNLCLIALMLSPSVFAAPYVGIEYGIAAIDHDFEPIIEGVQLNPDMDDGVFGIFAGYQFNDNLAMELGYRQFDLSDGRGYESIDMGSFTETETDWDADINAKQLTLMPVYSYHINDQWKLKTGAGISYTQYNFNSSYREIDEHILTDVETVKKYVKGESGTSNELGGIVSLALEYAIIPSWNIGANVKYQVDSYANTASLSLMTSYNF